MCYMNAVNCLWCKRQLIYPYYIRLRNICGEEQGRKHNCKQLKSHVLKWKLLGDLKLLLAYNSVSLFQLIKFGCN